MEERNIPFLQSCPTCDYRAKYDKIQLLEQKVMEMDNEDPAKMALAETIAEQIEELLDFGYFISQNVCEGNRRAYYSILN